MHDIEAAAYARALEDAAQAIEVQWVGYKYEELTDDFGKPRYDLAMKIAKAIRAIPNPYSDR